MNEWMKWALDHYSHTCYTGPGEPTEDDDINQMTLTSRHRIWNSSPSDLKLSTLPLGHGCSRKKLIFLQKSGVVSLKPECQSWEQGPVLRRYREAVLATINFSWSSDFWSVIDKLLMYSNIYSLNSIYWKISQRVMKWMGFMSPLCTYRLNWAKLNEMALPSRHRIWISRPSLLLLGHTSELGTNIKNNLKLECRTRDLRLSKQAALNHCTSAPAPVSMRVSIQKPFNCQIDKL